MAMLCRRVRFTPVMAYLPRVCSRGLTTAEVSTALRPFYFAVHPDFFGQYPRERAVNDTSLKKLNSYLDCLYDQHYVKPTTLTFYLRDSQDDKTNTGEAGASSTAMSQVTFTLESSDVRHTVHQILKSCKMPTDFVKSIPSKGVFPRPIRWDPSYYTYYGKVPPEDILSSKPIVKPDTLRYWLKDNMRLVYQKVKSKQQLEEEIQSLSESLRLELGLKDIIWHCGWGVSAYRACLRSFSRLCEQHRSDMDILSGRSLIFSTATGVSRNGSIVLSSGDVPHHWLMLLGSFHTFREVLSDLPRLEEAVSAQLGDIQIIQRENERVMLAEDYQTLLMRLLRSVVNYYRRRSHIFVSEYSNLHYDDDVEGPEKPARGLLQDLQMLVECDAGDVRLLSNGQFHVPASYPPVLLLEYILSKQNEARFRHQEFLRSEEKLREVVEKCKREFDLAKLTKDDGVSAEQMIACCHRLIENPYEPGASLQGLSLKISQFYAVSQDGEISIPWDWKI
ncbi:T-cell activation inhibitor, mitochondrial-like isoform X2 [Ptychodera flava]|uniref:T-cell activation inhibitor, mitochondrial-like isoform X2 n=1 Tax=Ptychodera flava TaxID=63121 RepID=UPI00396AAE52